MTRRRASARGGMLAELALQGLAMHLERACGGRDVASVLGQDALNVFPLHALDRERVVDRSRGSVAAAVMEGDLDGTRIHRLYQVLRSAELDGLHRGRNAGIACEHHDTHVGLGGLELRDE